MKCRLETLLGKMTAFLDGVIVIDWIKYALTQDCREEITHTIAQTIAKSLKILATYKRIINNCFLQLAGTTTKHFY